MRSWLLGMHVSAVCSHGHIETFGRQPFVKHNLPGLYLRKCTRESVAWHVANADRQMRLVVRKSKVRLAIGLLSPL